MQIIINIAHIVTLLIRILLGIVQNLEFQKLQFVPNVEEQKTI